YRFVITTGGTITVTLTGLPADYDLRLYRNNSNVASSSNGGTTSETINYTATANTYYARVVGWSGAFNATSCYTLKVQLGTASKQEDLITSENITVFPNPVLDKVTVRIKDLEGSAAIRVFDMYGRMVMQQSSSQPLTQLDVSKLSSGIYLIKVMNGGKESTMKIVKE
ncbi:MAG: T9SS type A sorting domain-containing protein, partial [Bacteroidota bacterium]